MIAAGFGASWIVTASARLLGWYHPVFIGRDPANRGGQIGEFILTAFVGPRLLAESGYGHFRDGELTAAVFAMTLGVSVAWAAFVGIVVLQAAYLSGLFAA